MSGAGIVGLEVKLVPNLHWNPARANHRIGMLGWGIQTSIDETSEARWFTLILERTQEKTGLQSERYHIMGT